MMRSMYSGVSGLRAHQTKMDVIGNNIANVNTSGFKSQRVTFNDIFSQTLQTANAASDETGRGGRNPMQVGLGVNVSSIDVLMTPGSAQRTDNPFDLMIDGDGFMVVGDVTGSYFTRAGALRVDDEGNIVIPNGMKVQGWQPTEDGKGITKGEIGDLNVNKFKTSEPKATTDVEFVGNLNPNDSPVPSQVKMYDSLGNLYTTNVQYIYTGQTGTAPNTQAIWTMAYTDIIGAPPAGGGAAPKTHIQLTDTDGNKVAIPLPAAGLTIDAANGKAYCGQIAYDSAGKLVATSATPPAVPTPPATIPAPPAAALAPGIVPLTTDFNLLGGFKVDGDGFVTATPAGINATIGAGANGTISVDVSKTTQYASKSNIDPKTKNGTSAGKLQGYAVGADGKITAQYDNGAMKYLGQIVVAEFDNPAGLEKVGDNLFQKTANSGDFDNIGKTGNFQAGVLEMSNVDLSKEFTEMIVTQRGFQANSKIISTSDEMLQELVNLKR